MNASPLPQRVIPNATWLAVGTLTETNEAIEWGPVMQVMISRARQAQRSIYEILRAPWQFSALNDYRGMPMSAEEKVLELVRADLGAGEQALEQQALAKAQEMLALPPDQAILPPSATLYWSPRSMIPAGSLPRGWDWSQLHCFTYEGIPAERFVFAMTVPRGDKSAGNQAQFAMA